MSTKKKTNSATPKKVIRLADAIAKAKLWENVGARGSRQRANIITKKVQSLASLDSGLPLVVLVGNGAYRAALRVGDYVVKVPLRKAAISESYAEHRRWNHYGVSNPKLRALLAPIIHYNNGVIVTRYYPHNEGDIGLYSKVERIVPRSMSGDLHWRNLVRLYNGHPKILDYGYGVVE
ncbi:MAG: hypothetical protein SFU83_19495 [Meiothermus sp.]|nr:hypothetical protein [Meiothermus sp.]